LKRPLSPWFQAEGIRDPIRYARARELDDRLPAPAHCVLSELHMPGDDLRRGDSL
jgi:hypothetical protein